jgi:hypothetical protein
MRSSGYDGFLSALIRPDHGTGPHPHRSWLHLLAAEPEYLPSEGVMEEVRSALIRSGLARATSDGGLRPGPDFTSSLSGRPPVSLSGGPPRGSVTVEAGIWRCYADPGPAGFQSDPVTNYLARCPACGEVMNFFLLRFPEPDPYLTACPRCGSLTSVLALDWSPELPKGRFEVTFGDLDRRPTLRHHPIYRELEGIVGGPLREVHVTL